MGRYILGRENTCKLLNSRIYNKMKDIETYIEDKKKGDILDDDSIDTVIDELESVYKLQKLYNGLC